MVKKLWKIFAFIIPFILLFAALVLSIAPDFYRLSITPAGKTFPLVHNHITDYYYYLSLIHQGYEGNWLLTSRMTPENFQPVLAQTFFAALGHFARMGNMSVVTIYFLSRIMFGIILMLTAIYIIKKLFKSNKQIILASFLVFFSTGFWTISNTSGQLSVNQFLTFWTRLDPILRTTYLPHHLLSSALGIISLICLADALDRHDGKKAILAGVAGFLSGIIYFATMVNVLGGAGLILFIFLGVSLLNKQMHKKYRMLPVFFYYFALCGFSFLYLYQIAKTTFPWSTYNTAGERFTFGIPITDYIAVLGPTFILTLLGIPRILKEKKWLPRLLLGWAVFPFLGLMIISRIFWRFADIYYLEATSYISLGILAIYGWNTLEDKLFKKVRGSWFPAVIILLLYFIPPIISSFRQQLTTFSPYYYNLYIPNEVITGINWLDYNSPKQSVILAGGFFGSIIPAFTHNRVVYGHPANTYNPVEKSKDADLFFAQKDADGAAKMLEKYHVSYIFYALDTDQPNSQFLQALPVTEVYGNNIVKIFKVEY